MVGIKLDTSKTLGTIKPMHAVGQPPFDGGFLKFDFSYIKHLKDANIPYSRLHDVGGAFGGNRFVDIPNIFRNFDADENDPANYHFAFTDILLEAMYSYDVKPIFRLGVTIENQGHIEAFHIYPPKDNAKWARICEHIIRHYNEGWANGYHYGIEYWEIWNEPENGPDPDRNQTWKGTAEQFYELYDVTAKHLKTCFGDSIKVGGYGGSGLYGIFYYPERYGADAPAMEIKDQYTYDKSMHRVNFFLNFIKYIKEHETPIDFFSTHSYLDTEKTVQMIRFVNRVLEENGYGDIELQLNEWNNTRNMLLHGSSFASATAASMMLAMQNEKIDMLCYYDARLTASTYGGFFAPLTQKPVCTYYAFAAFGRLYALGTQAEAVIECEKEGFYAVAATDGKRNALMICNRTGETRELCIEGADLTDARYYLLDGTHLLSMAFDAETIANDTVMLIEW